MSSNITSLIIWLLIIGLVLFVVHKIMSKFKLPKVGALCLVSGGVKTGKSTFSVALVMSNYKRIHRRWKIRKFFCEILGKEIEEEPLIYSNIPLSVPYVPLTEELLTRKKRFRYGSVIYVCEASLVADSQMIKDMDLNNRLLLFNKLIGHSTKGGMIIYDTQSTMDVHYSVKRCLSEYFYIHHLIKWIPFFMIAFVREERYSADGVVINSYDNDVEDSLKKVIIPKSTWKKFDRYCYSTMTDDLAVVDNIVHTNDLKARKLVSFRDWAKYIGDGSNAEKNDLTASYDTLGENNEKEND